MSVCEFMYVHVCELLWGDSHLWLWQLSLASLWMLADIAHTPRVHNLQCILWQQCRQQLQGNCMTASMLHDRQRRVALPLLTRTKDAFN